MKENNRNYFNNSKVANSLSKFDLHQNISVSEFGKNKQLASYINFTSNDLEKLDLSISRFDLAIMDSVYTLLINGKTDFSPEMVANIMFGKEVKINKETDTKMERIIQAVERLSMIRIKIDCTEIMRQKKKIAPNAKMIVSGALLPLTGLYVLSPVKKEDKVIYHLDRKPVLYEYAELLGRVISVPSKLLALEGVREDTDFVIIKQELTKEIEIMRNENNNYSATDITYEWKNGDKTGGFFERIGLQESDYLNKNQWQKRKSKLNKQVSIILDHFVDIGYIEGYHFNKTSKQITGIHIDLKVQDLQKNEELETE